ncbi:dentin sialophospho -like isoform X3 [Brachionus plicatilis]|uniref:Dentin sialophospho-like isoform X3 n=1 Tax=Brachionus plicatilis TaxID=10195 RepID=A0A3M7RJ19_BRAPC|nr:dentin sialophospho -like isoform X3 [Brachionus plicatilis]
MERKLSQNNSENSTEYTELENSETKTDQTEEETVFQSILTNTENSECEFEKKYKCNDMVLLVDDQSECKNLNKLNSLSNGDFIEEDFIPNQLNISNSDDEYSNLRESNFDHFQNIKNNLNQFDQNVKIIEQKDKIFLPKAQNVKNSRSKMKCNSLNDISIAADNFRSILNTEQTNNQIFSEATVLNRNNLSHSSSLSSSYSNINSNPNKSSSNSLTNHLELKFESESSIEDNSKFNLNTSALTESTILVSENKARNLDENKMSNHEATIWSETEAMINQFDQIGPSACGSTAILNVLKALNFEFDLQNVCTEIKVNLRIPDEMAPSSTLAEYLFSQQFVIP